MPQATRTRQALLPPVQVEEHCPKPPPRPGENTNFVREGTPLVMSLSCLLTVEHTNATVHPYVKQDIACAKSVPYHIWTDAILKLDKRKLKKWVAHIKRHEWRKDPVIQEALIQFCELAKDQFGAFDSYPIEDIKITRNDPKYIERIPEQGVLGALRKPDLLFVLPSVPKRLARKALRAPVQEDFSPSDGSTESKRARQHDDSESLHITKRSSTGSGAAKSDIVTLDATVQAGGYALEVASCTYGTRLFCLGTVMEDDKISLWYYDAVGIVRTQETLSIIHDFETFAAVHIGFACCEPSQWGALPPVIRPPPSPAYPETFPPQSLRGYTFDTSVQSTGEKVKITLEDPIFSQYSLVGRRTFLYAIKTKSKTLKKPLIAKFSYQVTTRRPEQDFVKIAREAGAGHLPEVHMWEDLWKMSDGVRAAFHEKSDEYEDRVLRALVYTQYFPLKELFSNSGDLIPDMVNQMLDCLHDLRYKANILHRDISCHNVMYEMRGEKVNYILIDFDYATTVNTRGEPQPSTKCKHRTGTLPFMAYELIQDMADRELGNYRAVAHLLRHDYESLFYLALCNKKLLCTEMGRTDKITFPPECEALRPWFRRWNALLATAAMQLEQHRLDAFHDDGYGDPLFDRETVGGTLSRDSIKRALSGKVRRMRLVAADPEETEFDPLFRDHETKDPAEPEDIQESVGFEGREESHASENDTNDLHRTVLQRSKGRGSPKQGPKAKKAATTRKVAEAKKAIEKKKPTAAKRVADTKNLEAMAKTANAGATSTKPSRRARKTGQATATKGMKTRSMAKNSVAG
ncbi:hypothetical protein EW026_g6698 [Hermanssonia centrifuga]|uniref:Protein kinase domain-containing protein n=1 Tax=Hermanssonia centrifuga TaxID=98765 RepID=A0A4S4KA71_9APHY|nr:hypothetical protein EW026_g6698 [Hermanssonia centrifuga]